MKTLFTYPANNSKLADCLVQFQWMGPNGNLRLKTGYLVQLIEVKDERTNFLLKPTFSQFVTGLNVSSKLNPESSYVCVLMYGKKDKLEELQLKKKVLITKRSFNGSRSFKDQVNEYLAKTLEILKYLMKANQIADVTHDLSKIQLDTPNENIPEVIYDCIVVYTKPQINHLKSYLEKRVTISKGRKTQPFIPLYFAMVERYLEAKRLNSLVHLTPLDSAFKSVVDKIEPGLISDDFLRSQLINYHDPNLTPVKEKLYDRDFLTFPGLSETEKSKDWFKKIATTLISPETIPLIEFLRKPVSKTIDLYFKLLSIDERDLEIGETLKIPLPTYLKDKLFTYTISGGNEVTDLDLDIILKVYTKSGGTLELIFGYLKEDDHQEFLCFKGDRLLNLDSASYEAQLFRRIVLNPLSQGNKKTRDLSIKDETGIIGKGKILIWGGVPFLININPEGSVRDKVQYVDVKVRNGGIPKKLSFTKGSQTSEIPRVNVIDQTFDYQVIRFKLPGNLPMDTDHVLGTYDAFYVNTDNNFSSNCLKFEIVDYLYRIEIEKLKCWNESNPEVGAYHDTIFFSTFMNTEKFIQEAILSQKYGNMDGGDEVTEFLRSSLNGAINIDSQIFPYKVSQNAPSYRVIEDFIECTFSIYEYDNPKWRKIFYEWLVRLVETLAKTLINMVTLGIGGWILDVALQVSGYYKWRSQQISDLAASQNVDLLCQGNEKIVPGTLASNDWIDNENEQKYAETFHVRMIDEADYEIMFNLFRKQALITI